MMPSFPSYLVWKVIFVLSILSLQSIYAEDSSCGSVTKCSDCIQLPNCKWCSKLKSNVTNQVMCFAYDKDLADICYDETSTYVENPQQTAEKIKDEPLTEKTTNNRDRPIQLRPQEVKLSLRKGKAYSLDVEYVQAEDYPVDLYYLMDLSNSMKDDKVNIARLGKEIATTLQKHTSKVRLGFGSFIDKVALPFVDMQPAKLENPCTKEHPCVRPYSFINDLPLTDRLDDFKIGVDRAKISGNIDSPEGGFDALMQVIKCKNQIGWDDNVRKIVVFSTDASFHSAGDGKLAGVVIPNDEQCHLNDSNKYEDYLEYDYPSVSQINKVVKEENINLIFAIAESKQKDLYEDLSKQIDASSMGLLEKGSTDIVNLVEKQYLAIKSKIEIKDNTAELNREVALEVYAKCPRDKFYSKKRICDDLKTGDKVGIRLDITLLSCPDNSSPTELIVRTSQDQISIKVEAMCECNCSNPNNPLNNEDTDECGEGGSLTCGVCNCASGYYGNNCRCKIGEGHESSEEDKKNCFKNGDDEECSGNGHCSCGLCECKEDFSGRLCECNERLWCLSETSTSSTSLCSGKGTCECNKCSCEPGRNGTKCECPDDSACKAPGETEVCSGVGSCDCGVCTCDSSGNYFGQYCEDCPTCNNGRCDQFKNCAQYKGFETGQLTASEFNNNCSLGSDPSLEMYKADDLTSESNLGALLCISEDEEDGCLFNFTYRYVPTDRKYVITVKEFKDCPEPPNVLAITIGVIAAIVAIGLLTLLLWKLLTTLHDKREFAKFEDEMNKSKWQTEENPIFKPATTEVLNPAFVK